MKIMKMIMQEFEDGNIILFYYCKYKRRINFNKKPKYKSTYFNISNYYSFKSDHEYYNFKDLKIKGE